MKNRPSGFVHAKNKPMKDYEIISVFSKGSTNHKNMSKNRMIYNPQGLKKIYEIRNKYHKKDGFYNNKSLRSDKPFISEYTNYPKMILKEFASHHNVGNYHPSQKPVELIKYLICTYSFENDTILDFTMGSGTTGIACKETNRNFIGIEKDKKYFDIAKERINEENLLDFFE